MWQILFSPYRWGNPENISKWYKRISHLQREPPSCLQRHGDEGDNGVGDSQVEHKVVHIGPRPEQLHELRLTFDFWFNFSLGTKLMILVHGHWVIIIYNATFFLKRPVYKWGRKKKKWGQSSIVMLDLIRDPLLLKQMPKKQTGFVLLLKQNKSDLVFHHQN